MTQENRKIQRDKDRKGKREIQRKGYRGGHRTDKEDRDVRQRLKYVNIYNTFSWPPCI